MLTNIEKHDLEIQILNGITEMRNLMRQFEYKSIQTSRILNGLEQAKKTVSTLETIPESEEELAAHHQFAQAHLENEDYGGNEYQESMMSMYGHEREEFNL